MLDNDNDFDIAFKLISELPYELQISIFKDAMIDYFLLFKKVTLSSYKDWGGFCRNERNLPIYGILWNESMLCQLLSVIKSDKNDSHFNAILCLVIQEMKLDVRDLTEPHIKEFAEFVSSKSTKIKLLYMEYTYNKDLSFFQTQVGQNFLEFGCGKVVKVHNQVILEDLKFVTSLRLVGYSVIELAYEL
ncbi:unnamed protein product [Ambrosiozyma monospora]|uniref:Unnamed protein product n=1 Tax=Ambrosiozyma monospora TaxID=43982 RepID=A0ACB5T6T8_AMBMO|nr:unnamed protein product [Ambrosiozyma monospora]